MIETKLPQPPPAQSDRHCWWQCAHFLGPFLPTMLVQSSQLLVDSPTHMGPPKVSSENYYWPKRQTPKKTQATEVKN